MGKHKDEDIVEKLEKEIKELKSINRGLQKQLKKEQKKYKPEHTDEELFKEEIAKTKKVKCAECGRGEVQETKLGPRILIACTVCSYRKSLKHNNGEEEKEI